jgi:hypothetical protein
LPFALVARSWKHVRFPATAVLGFTCTRSPPRACADAADSPHRTAPEAAKVAASLAVVAQL